MPFKYWFNVGSIQKISLLDADPITKRLESLRRAHKCCDRMPIFNRLPNDLQPRAPGGPQYNQLHTASLSTTLSAKRPRSAGQYGDRRYTALSISTFRFFIISGGLKPIFLNPSAALFFAFWNASSSCQTAVVTTLWRLSPSFFS